jgi:hypothetical protein
MAMIGGGGSSSKSSASKIPTIPEVSGEITGDYLKQMPEILQFLQQYTPQLERTMLANTAGSAPVIQALESQNLGSLGQATQGVNAGAFGQAMGMRELEQQQLQRLNPEFYSSRAASGEALKTLLNPNLSGGELSNIERGMNRQFLQEGTFNAPSHMNELNAAINYGDAARNRIMQGTTAAQGLLPQLNAGTPDLKYNPLQVDPSMAKIDQSAGKESTKMLFTNPTEAASQAYIAAVGNQTPKSKSSSTDVSV